MKFANLSSCVSQLRLYVSMNYGSTWGALVVSDVAEWMDGQTPRRLRDRIRCKSTATNSTARKRTKEGLSGSDDAYVHLLFSIEHGIEICMI